MLDRERLVIEQFPGWSGGKARLDMLGAVRWDWLDGSTSQKEAMTLGRRLAAWTADVAALGLFAAHQTVRFLLILDFFYDHKRLSYNRYILYISLYIRAVSLVLQSHALLQTALIPQRHCLG